MNLFTAQSVHAMTELMQLANLKQHIISPRLGAPIVQIIQDTLSGVYRLTRGHVRIPFREAMNMLARWDIPLSQFERRESYTGLELMSHIMPHLTGKFGKLVVQDGKIMSGQMDSKAVISNGALIHVLYNDFGPEATARFINQTQALLHKYFLVDGFSVGLQDMIIPAEVKQKLQDTIPLVKDEVAELIRSIHAGTWENNTGRTNAEELEIRIRNLIATKVTEFALNIAKDLDGENRIMAMVRSGAKAKEDNVMQMVALLGQQNIDGKRAPYSFQDRTLPHFPKYDDGLESRGFVDHNFLTGLDPAEYFFHAMGGREGLIDTAVKSVTRDTQVLIQEGADGASVAPCKVVAIGDWIDGLLDSADSADITVYGPEEANMELLKLRQPVYIPTVDEKGNTSWGLLTQVTRHDPGDKLYEVETQSGRKVTVTAAHSLLVWNPETETFQERDAPSVNIGDYMPTDIEILYRENPDFDKDYRIVNDCILDSVVRITPIEPGEHKKMYDVTVPSTLNFMLANGLGVRDTSSTGYLQRKIMKMMEDLKAEQDRTVRNPSQRIVQFRYGDDNVDSTKVEKVGIELASWSNENITREFGLSADDLSEILTPEALKNLKTPVMDGINDIRRDRDVLIRGVFQFRSREDDVYVAVNCKRLLSKYHNPSNSKTDLLPEYVMERLKGFIAKPYVQNELFGVVARFFLAPKKVIVESRLTKATFDLLLSEMEYIYMKSLVHPAEAVGPVAAQSIGEPTTQLSFAYETDLLWQGKVRQIGDIVEQYVRDATAQNMPVTYMEDSDTTIVDISNLNVNIRTVDENGEVSTALVTAVTRHPPNGQLVKVMTRSGKEVIGTMAKSFLVLTDDGKVTPIEGNKLTLGMKIPSELPRVVQGHLKTLDLKTVLPPNDLFYYTSDVRAEVARLNQPRNAWPTKLRTRYDRIRKESGMMLNLLKMENGRTELPQCIPLDSDWGFFFGIYLADGHAASNGMICITKKNDAVRTRAKEMFESLGIHTREKIDEPKKWGTTTTLFGNSKILTHVLKSLFGHGSHNKRLPDWVLTSNMEFRRALLDGYFSGDGWVADLRGMHVSCHSVHKLLLHDIQRILHSLGIHSQIHWETHLWRLDMFGDQAHKFAQTIYLTNDEKQGKLDVLLDRFVGRVWDAMDVSGNVLWDPIVSLTPYDTPHPYVYDITVPATLNFATADSIFVRDTLNTFHSAGTAKANATSGVPRITELADMSTKPKKPSNTVYLSEDKATSQDAAIAMKKQLQTTKLKDIVKNLRVYWDPKDEDSVIVEDRDMVRSYLDIMAAEPTEQAKSPWLIRMEMDEEELIGRGLTMEDVKTRLESISSVADVKTADTNAPNLICRVRMNLPEDSSIEFHETRRAIYELEEAVLNGVSGVNRVFVREEGGEFYHNPELGVYEIRKPWVCDTEGANLWEIMTQEFVDTTRTFSNNILEVQEVFGIEAARTALYNEFMEALGGSAVNYHHMCLMVDTMTQNGFFASVNRHGMGKNDDIGPLAKASFETSDAVIVQAAMFGELDTVTGVSANIMLGQLPTVGTGTVTVFVDETLLPSAPEQLTHPTELELPETNVESVLENLVLDMGFEGIVAE